MGYKTNLQKNNANLQNILNILLSITPKIITFTIGSTPYQAEEGMTWAEWCDSDYNTDEFVAGEYVQNRYDYYLKNSSRIWCSASDTIISGGVYILESLTSGGGTN